MRNNPDIPNELYYLDENFSVRSLRKYQLKEILAAHQIPYLQSITRIDLINLFKKNIEPRREEILREYKKKALEEQKAQNQEEFGRGHRTHKPVKLEEDFQEWPSRQHHKKAEVVKDSDGFAIPSLPDRPKVPQFNAEDSFASSDEEAVKAKPRPVKPKAIPKAVPKAKKANVATPAPSSSTATTTTTTNSKVRKTKAKFTPPSFNAEDSFASSDSEVDDVVKPRSNVSRKSPSPVEKSVEVKEEMLPVVEPTVNDEAEVSNAADSPVLEEEDDDADYNADGDNSDDEDEEIGEVDKEELVQLYKDQSVPPEIFYSKEYRVTTRSQKMAAARERMMAWKGRLKRIGFIFGCIYLLVGFVGFAITSYARQKNGYCQNYPTPSATPTKASKRTFSVFNMLPPSCIPCPDHGICTQGELVCDTLYERKTPFYNIGHILPVADDCIHNSVLGKYVSKVERKIKNYLARRQGERACEHEIAHPGQPVPVARTSVKEVLADLKDKMNVNLPADKLDEILVIALSAVLEDPKIHYWEVDEQRYLGTDHIQYPLRCQIKRIYHGIPFVIKIYIILFISATSAIIGATKDYRKSVLYKEKISNLVKSTTDQLKEQYDNHTKEPTKYPSPALSVSQIRSSIVDVNDRRTIQDWQRVVEQIEVHPHIRKSFREVRGDPVEYWELTA